MSFTSRVACTALALCALASAGAAAQEIGVYYTDGSSGLHELGSPGGFGVYIGAYPTARTSVRAAYYRTTSRSVRQSRVCTTYFPPIACGPEAVEMDAVLAGLALDGALRHRPLHWIELLAGAGASINSLNATDHTASGRKSSLFVRNSAQIGASLLAAVRVRPVARVPLVLETGFARRWIRLGGCAEDPARDDPFCGSVAVNELRAGVALSPRW